MTKYSLLQCFHGDYAIAAITIKKHYKWGLIDRSGKEVIPIAYDNIEYIGGDLVCVNTGYKEGRIYEHSGKWGVVNLKNEIVIPFIYSDFHAWDSFAIVRYRNKYGIIDYNGNTLIKTKYDSLLPTNHKDIFVFKIKDKYGLIDNREEIVIAPIYDEIMSCNSFDPEGWLVVCKNEQWFYIDLNGRVVLS